MWESAVWVLDRNQPQKQEQKQCLNIQAENTDICSTYSVVHSRSVYRVQQQQADTDIWAHHKVCDTFIQYEQTIFVDGMKKLYILIIK